MASHDPNSTLFRQYVELTKTSPRQMAERGPLAENATDPGVMDQPEAEWSLRRIEKRVGSIA